MAGMAERVRARLHLRSASYQALFTLRALPTVDAAPWWAFWRATRPGELKPPGEIVLRDLARYCYVSRPTLKVSQVTQQSDALAMAFAEGRRDVFNRITALCNLTSDQIERISQRGNDE
ncbi:MAG: hypothetical protein RLZZ373_2684 [Pseudomonadota bacterium]|jgi:hypothetical protein